MAIYIKGVEMPKDDDCTILTVYSDGVVYLRQYKDRLCLEDSTNATSIPEPHGRLIDADILVGELKSDIAFINEQLKEYRLKPHNFVDDFDKKIKVVENKLLDEISIIEAAPTVIEGSE